MRYRSVAEPPSVYPRDGREPQVKSYWMHLHGADRDLQTRWRRELVVLRSHTQVQERGVPLLGHETGVPAKPNLRAREALCRCQQSAPHAKVVDVEFTGDQPHARHLYAWFLLWKL